MSSASQGLPSGSVHRRRWKERLHGALIPAVPVPMSADGRIHHDAHARYVAYMAKQRVRGVAVWAHTGRGLHLGSDERAYVLSAWRGALSGEQILVAGAGARLDTSLPEQQRLEAFSDGAMRMAEDALRLGADALLVYAPVAYRDLVDRDARIIEHHRRLATLGAPLILFYLYEQAGGISYTPEVLAELFSLPQVVGIKVATLDSVMTYQDISRLILSRFPDLTLITGEDRMLGYTLMRSATAALIGMGAACTEIQASLIEAYLTGDSSRFLRLSNQVDAFSEVTFIPPMEAYIVRMLWTLVLLGVIPPEAAHDPLGYTISDTELAALKVVVEALQTAA